MLEIDSPSRATDPAPAPGTSGVYADTEQRVPVGYPDSEQHV